ncbi:MAG: hypothetical protein HYR91_05395 [Flavobacteriia bacterium]|nr:hypothetical protein [Flavobacteriia bacterium]
MNFLISLILTLCSIYPIYSQSISNFGSRSNALGNASVTLDDVWSFYNNPGSIAKIKSTTFGLAYQNKYNLKETQYQAFVLAIRLKKNVFSGGGIYYGNDAFKYYKIGFGYGLKLTDKLYAGVQLNTIGIRLPSYYGSTSKLTAEIGLLAELTEKILLGCSIYNITNSKLANYQNERLSTVMKIGLSYSISTHINYLIEIEKDIYNPIRIKSGIEYQIKNKFFLRTGVTSKPISINFGFGYKLKQFQMDLGSSFQQRIGWSTNFSLNYLFNQK